MLFDEKITIRLDTYYHGYDRGFDVRLTLSYLYINFTTIFTSDIQTETAAVMACVDPILHFDDQSFALQLQLAEIEAQRELQTGKWAEDSPPDFALAFNEFEAELNKAIGLLGDLKFAHSIAKAVDSDAVAIEEIRVEETQSIQDRGLALSMNEDGTVPSRHVTDLAGPSYLGTESVDWDFVLRATEASTYSVESSSTLAGPSDFYAHGQRAVIEQLSQLKVESVVCRDSFHPHASVQLACSVLAWFSSDSSGVGDQLRKIG